MVGGVGVLFCAYLCEPIKRTFFIFMFSLNLDTKFFQIFNNGSFFYKGKKKNEKETGKEEKGRKEKDKADLRVAILHRRCNRSSHFLLKK